MARTGTSLRLPTDGDVSNDDLHNQSLWWPCHEACLWSGTRRQPLHLIVIIRNWEVTPDISYDHASMNQLYYMEKACVGLIYIMTCTSIIWYSLSAFVEYSKGTLHSQYVVLHCSHTMKLYLCRCNNLYIPWKALEIQCLIMGISKLTDIHSVFN
jgi:hypothetical protein